MALVAAATLVAELGDITRFGNPRQLMAYLGLVPSEHSSGGTRRQGGITKAGNGAARRMLIEAVAGGNRKLARAGKPPTVVTAAIARELAGFVWAIARQAQPIGA